ncbi:MULTISPECIES: alpha/beta fold hydrolase [unclassified Streptomyces]|uniref:alpha/beta fold hydrolase n=1 Tax=unclassified Streptomyces TaxID=2593676 RepID=UPI00365A5A99
MPLIDVNGIRLHYYDNPADKPAAPTGSGRAAPAVLLIMGSGSKGRAWHLHQVPALVAAGLRVITFDNRGIAPSDECAGGFGLADLVADTAALIEELRLGPCQVVGTSMGAYVAQELALARPELVDRLVLMATRGRADAVRSALSRAEIELYDTDVRLPASYEAVIEAMQMLSPTTLDDDQRARDWLDLLELTRASGPGSRAHLGITVGSDRRTAYRDIRVPTRVIAFEDDLISPPRLGREVAEAIPGAEFEVLPDCGHYGYLEQPEAVNKSLIGFLRT